MKTKLETAPKPQNTPTTSPRLRVRTQIKAGSKRIYVGNLPD